MSLQNRSGFKTPDHACGQGAGRFESGATAIGCEHSARPAIPPSAGPPDARRDYETPSNLVRYDLQLIASWIEPGAKVIDLGCGEGDLLHYLITHKGVHGTGIERNEDKVAHCIERGLSVLQGDINEEVHDYPEGSFDYVILSQTLQQVYEPAGLIRAMLHIGRKGIVTFPNFSHWGIRLQVLFTGYAPVSRQLPFQWFDTPNIRVITLKDFRRFVHDVGLRVLREAPINTHSQDRFGSIARFLPNLRATYGLFMIGK